jgi:hypothetical protein
VGGSQGNDLEEAEDDLRRRLSQDRQLLGGFLDGEGVGARIHEDIVDALSS